MSKKKRPATSEIVAELEKHFRQRVLRITAPGGKGRGSYRAEFADQSVIVTYRHNLARTQLEAHVLKSLGRHSQDMPQFLGYKDGLLFQSDVGGTRLSQAVQNAPASRRVDLAAEAVAAIFRIHAASRNTKLIAELPHLGGNSAWVMAVVEGIDKIAGYLGTRAPILDRLAICEALAKPATQFLKWDCRSGNAALDATGKLRWFDFEYSGLRHGAEDFAWLIGDEIWPVGAEVMLDIVADAFDPASGHEREAYVSYLALYTTFHAIQRIMLIVREVRRRGWSPQSRAVRYDKVGTHPVLGARISETAAFCADRNGLTRPMVPLLEAMGGLFTATMPDVQSRLAG